MHSSPGPRNLFQIYAPLLKGINTVGFIHSNGGFDRVSDLDFSTWKTGLYKDADYDIYGSQDQSPKRGIAENYPNLIMYLFTPIGNLLRRDSENTFGNSGYSFPIGNGYYCDPKATKYFKNNP